MVTSVVDLRYKMKDVLQALSRRERVKVTYHGRIKGEIIPVSEQDGSKVQDHPFFGMSQGDGRSVEEVMQSIRGGRYRAV